MKTYIKIAATALMALTLGGCATLFGDNGRTVAVNSQPEGAKIYLNNQYVGATPSMITINQLWSPNTIEIKKPGYQSAVHMINGKFQPVGVLNIFIWPGFIVDAISGDMMRIPEANRNVTVNLTK